MNKMKSFKTLALLFSALLFLTCCGSSDSKPTPSPPDEQNPEQPSDPEKPTPEPTYKPEKIVRMIVLGDPYKSEHWMANKAHGLRKDYTAQDILEIIEDLKPDCLERFVTGKQDPDELVPVRPGCPPMTILEFLNAAILAGGENCYIIPKLNLNWLTKAWNSEELFWDSAQNLYDLPLVRPIRNINLDVWTFYCDETTPEQRDAMFKRLREIGYEKIGVNFTGNINTNDPNIDYGDFNINKDNWTVNETSLEKFKSYKNLKEYHFYIDYPEPMHTFMKLSPDQQADVYCNEIYPKQLTMGFTYVYPIIQDEWDARESITLITGPYKGKTMYDITKELLNKPYE